MTKEQITTAQRLLSTKKNIVIVPHRNPDGDAMGSTLALMEYLQIKGHDATVVAPNDYPDFLKWLPGEDTVIRYNSQNKQALKKLENADIIFTLDFNSFSRTGDMETALEQSEATYIMIDHHQQPNDYAALTYSDTTMSSTCQMVYHFIEALGDKALITNTIATCIYTGIMTDTGSFRYRSTTATTHEVLSNLIKAGADNTAIHQNIYDTNTLARMQLLGVALKNLHVLPEYNTVYITLSQQELDNHNFKKGDTEGFVNYGLSLQDIIFAVIFIENTQEGIVKMSMRSKGNFSVNEFARKHYQGGGHTNAAGGKSDLPLDQTVTLFIETIKPYKPALSI